MTSHPISKAMKEHYSKTFSEHGTNSMGVDWGSQEDRAFLRHQKIADVFDLKDEEFSVLDVGCGYGAFLDYLNDSKNSYKNIEFVGIDVVPEMVETGQSNHPDARFICSDILQHNFEDQIFDYVVCNGILTQKLTANDDDMEDFAHQIIQRMFSLCRKGIVFNGMTSYVNFQVDNLFYKDPLEMLSWVMSEVSPHVKLNHAYPLYEYMIYAYKDDVVSK
jgi:SAM-dependent methyltransferase